MTACRGDNSKASPTALPPASFFMNLRAIMETPNPRINVLAGHLNVPNEGAQAFEMEPAARSLLAVLHAFFTLKPCNWCISNHVQLSQMACARS